MGKTRQECAYCAQIQSLQDVFASGLLCVQPHGSCTRLAWHVEHIGEGHQILVPMLSLIIPTDRLHSAAAKIMRAATMATADWIGTPMGTA